MYKYEAEMDIIKYNGKDYVCLVIPFFVIQMYIGTVSTYQFRETIKNEYNAILDYDKYLFQSLEDARSALDWMNSIIVMNRLTDQNSTFNNVDIDIKQTNPVTFKKFLKKHKEEV